MFITLSTDTRPSQASIRLTPGQLKGARGMLDWSRLDLAAAAGLSVSTVKRAEDAAPEVVSGHVLGILQNAFERAGVSFLADDGGGPGLRLRAG